MKFFREKGGKKYEINNFEKKISSRLKLFFSLNTRYFPLNRLKTKHSKMEKKVSVNSKKKIQLSLFPRNKERTLTLSFQEKLTLNQSLA